jgi:hypothetical protein
VTAERRCWSDMRALVEERSSKCSGGIGRTPRCKVSPVWNLGIEDAVELARAKRGVEPLRIVVMGQQCFGVCSDPPVMVAGLEPMPALF